MRDFWSSDKDFWSDNTDEELTDEDVVIQQEQEDIEEEEDDDWFAQLQREDPNDSLISTMKEDISLSSWIPAATPKKVNDTAKYAYNYLNQKGLPSHVSAGIVGNLMKESNLNPTIAEKGNTGNGRGIAQWDVRNRWKDLQNFASNSKRDYTSLETQLDFVLHEAKQRGDLDKTLQTKTPEEAAIVFGKTYEKPNEKYADWQGRQSYARGVMSNMKFGGLIKAQNGLNNEIDPIEGISDEAIQRYLEENYSVPELEVDQEDYGNNSSSAVGAVGNAVLGGIETFKNVKSTLSSIRDGASRYASSLIDTSNEIAGYNRNASSLRKFNEQKNRKKYQLNRTSQNNIPIYT